jgi:hypothetical protein
MRNARAAVGYRWGAPVTQTEPKQDGEQRGILAPGLIGRMTEIGQVLVPGSFAWFVTVVPGATARGANRVGWVLAFVAFCALVAGSFAARDRPRLGRILGIWTFLVLCVCTWVLNLPSISIERLDPVRASSGTFGWMLYGLGWGAPWRPGLHPEDNPRAQLHPKLDSRKPPNPAMPIAVAIATVGAVTAFVFAWRTADSMRAVMLQGAAIALSVALVTTSANVALAQAKQRSQPAARQRVLYALPWLMALFTLLVIAIAWVLSS